MKARIKFSEGEKDICNMSALVWQAEYESDEDVLAFFLSDLFDHLGIHLEDVLTRMHEHIGDIDFSRLVYKLNGESRQELKKALDDPEEYHRNLIAQYQAKYGASALGSA